MSIIINIVLIILLGWVLAQLKYILKDNYFYQILNVLLNLTTVSIILLDVYPIVFAYIEENFTAKFFLSVLIIFLFKIVDITRSYFYKKITASNKQETRNTVTIFISIVLFILLALYNIVSKIILKKQLIASRNYRNNG